MKKYELMAIIVNNVDEKVAQDVTKSSILGRITEFGGKTTFEDFWGARGYAYKINGEKWGYYFVCQFEMEGTMVTKLERELNIDNQIVRFLITSVDPKAPAPEKYEVLKARSEAEKKKKEAPVVEEKSSTEEKEVKKEAEETKELPKKDAVDKKFDQIMDDASAEL
jgi:small subunit ribosomal protein S6